jgi:hypothetical protein
VSLILDALKKLDREKNAPDKGVVVVGTAEWGAAERQPGVRLAVGLLGIAIAAGLAYWLTAAPAPEPQPRRAASRPVSPAPTRPPLEAAAPSPDAPAAQPALAPPPAPSRSARPVPTGSEADEPPLAAPPQDAPPHVAPAPAASAPAAPPEPPAPFRLTAIAHRDGQPVAMLNDRLVRVGDSFDGITVISIGSSEVEIEVDGRRMRLSF